MSISERYRDIVGNVGGFLDQARDDGQEPGQDARFVEKALETLRELAESVGEIPRIRLENELTPVLLKAHSQLDRARLLCEEGGAEDSGAAIWELEQQIYRLLNDL